MNIIEYEIFFKKCLCPHCKKNNEVPFLKDKETNIIMTTASFKYWECDYCKENIDLNIYTTAYLNKIRRKKVKKLLKEIV